MKEEDHFKNFEVIVRPADQDIKELTGDKVTQYNWIRKRDYINNRRGDFWRQIEIKRNETRQEVEALMKDCREFEKSLEFRGPFAGIITQIQAVLAKTDEREALLMKNAGFNHMIVDFYESGINQFYRQTIEEAVRTEREAEFCAKLAEMEGLKEQLKLDPNVYAAKLMEVKTSQAITKEKIMSLTEDKEVLDWYSYKAKRFGEIVKFKSELGHPPNQKYLNEHVMGERDKVVKAEKQLVKEGCLQKIKGKGTEKLFVPIKMPSLDWTRQYLKGDAPIVAPLDAPQREKTSSDDEQVDENASISEETPKNEGEELGDTDAPA